MPAPLRALTRTAVEPAAGVCVPPSGSRSILFQTRRIGLSASPRSARVSSTLPTWASTSGWDTSATCNSRSASWIPSRVARKAATRWVGSLLMNPTVSVNSTTVPEERRTRRVVGSRVANSWSATYARGGSDSSDAPEGVPAPAAQTAFNRELLPAFV